MKILVLSILFLTVYGDDLVQDRQRDGHENGHEHGHGHDLVKDRHRACPEGFRYFGEVDVPVHDRDYWVQGERQR